MMMMINNNRTNKNPFFRSRDGRHNNNTSRNPTTTTCITRYCCCCCRPRKNVWLWIIGSFIIITTMIITTMNITFLFLAYNNNNIDHMDVSVQQQQYLNSNMFQDYDYNDLMNPSRMYSYLNDKISSSSFRVTWFQQKVELKQQEKQQQQDELYVSKKIQIENPTKILGLFYPPGLVGGYRNQMIRYLSFIDYATKNNYTMIYTPSIIMASQLHSIGTDIQWYPILFHHIFDIPHWNLYVTKVTNIRNQLNNNSNNNNNRKTKNRPHVNNNKNPFHHTLPYLSDPNDEEFQKNTNRNKFDCWISFPNTTITALQNPHDFIHYDAENYTYYYQIPKNNNNNNHNNNDDTTTFLRVNHLQRYALLQGTIGQVQGQDLEQQPQQQPILPIPANITYLLWTNQMDLKNPRQLQIDYSKTTTMTNKNNCIRGPTSFYGGGTKAGILWSTYRKKIHPAIVNRIRTQQTQVVSQVSQQKQQSVDTIDSDRHLHENENDNDENDNENHMVVDETIYSYDTDILIYRALRPALQWRQLGKQCVIQNLQKSSSSSTSSTTSQQSLQLPYIALHARIEIEMMGHICQKKMEKNLTTILEHIHHYFHLSKNTTTTPSSSSSTSTTAGSSNIAGLFIAVSRAGMEVDDKVPLKHRIYAEDNMETLNIVTNYYNTNSHNNNNNDGTSSSTTTTTKTALASLSPLKLERYQRKQHHSFFQTMQSILPVFECGKQTLNEYYDQQRKQYEIQQQQKQDQQQPLLVQPLGDYGSLLEAVVNFQIAVDSKIFVGVVGSSYSTDVWTTRYYLGKGLQNFRYTLNGIEPVPNNGLPDPHTNCK